MSEVCSFSLLFALLLFFVVVVVDLDKFLGFWILNGIAAEWWLPRSFVPCAGIDSLLDNWWLDDSHRIWWKRFFPLTDALVELIDFRASRKFLVCFPPLDRIHNKNRFSFSAIAYSSGWCKNSETYYCSNNFQYVRKSSLSNHCLNLLELFSNLSELFRTCWNSLDNRP